MQIKPSYFFIIILLYSCNSVINTLYDDTTARYNAYFIANEVISEIEKELIETAEYNYDSLINLTYEIDTNRVSGLKEKKDNSIQKLSILIQRHPDSKYVYPSYALIGKSRLLAMDIGQAITTLKYVNSKTNNATAQQMSLIYLMRAYTEKKDYSAALEVNEFLKKLSIEKDLAIEYYLNAHYLHKKTNNLTETLNTLFELEKIVKNRRLINKVFFAIGQIYLIQNEYDIAALYFQKCLKNNPTFDMEFNAKIFYSKSLFNSSSEDVNKYFGKLLKDKKNIDKLDRIYYEIGLFNIKREKYNNAINNFKLSVVENKSKRELLYNSFKNIADIYYDNLIEYKLSKLYYDSALANINRENKDYSLLKEKSDVLTDLVNNLDIIERNDSLIHLTSIPEDELLKIIELNIENNEKKQREKRVKKESQNFLLSEPTIIDNNNNKGSWYFNNPSMVSSGRNEFQRKWGNRELADNWRISSKISFTSINDTIEEVAEDSSDEESVEKENEMNAEDLMSSLPFSDEDKNKLNKETEKAFVAIGKIYVQKLDEKLKGINTFKIFIERFSNSEYYAEVIYQLYLIDEENEKYKNIILKNFKETIFYKLIVNPDFEVDEFREYNLLRNLYGVLYDKLKNEENNHVINKVDSLQKIYSKNPFFENINLLRSIALGKKGGNFSLQFELKKYLNSAKDRSTIDFASSLLNSAETVHDDFIFSGLPRFKINKDDKYFFIIIKTENQTDNFSIKLENTLKELDKKIPIYSFRLNDTTYFDAISDNNLNSLKEIEEKFNLNLDTKEIKVNANFVVGEKNMNLIFKSKNFNEFVKFYNR